MHAFYRRIELALCVTIACLGSSMQYQMDLACLVTVTLRDLMVC